MACALHCVEHRAMGELDAGVKLKMERKIKYCMGVKNWCFSVLGLRVCFLPFPGVTHD